MFSLSPAKILVVLIVALLVLGPDKLPRMARQAGVLWNEIRLWRNKFESSVRETFPSLPATHEITSAVRSPVSFLDRLADQHAATDQTSGDSGSQGEAPPAASQELAAQSASAGEPAGSWGSRATAEGLEEQSGPMSGESAALGGAGSHSTDPWIGGPQAGDPNMN